MITELKNKNKKKEPIKSKIIKEISATQEDTKNYN